MSKKILSLVLFLISVLAVSCSNADKTGSGDNNSGIGDGSTTPQGIKKYVGTWILTPTVEQSASANWTMDIKNDGTIDLNIGTQQQQSISDITDKGNETYDVKFVDKDPGPGTLILTLKFNNDTSGTFTTSDIGSNDHLNGTMTKQKK